MDYRITEVLSKKQLKAFVHFPDLLYKGCPCYVPPIQKGQLKTLSQGRDRALTRCEARYWLVYHHRKVVGRVAAIINHGYNEKTGVAYMRFGWLDFIEDPAVLLLLLGAVEEWARERQLKVVHGPLGFTSFDASGVLVEGFDELPTAWGRYNHPYYGPMLEALGYKKEADWIEHRIEVPSDYTPKELKMATIMEKRFGLKQAELKGKKDIETYADKLFDMVNSSYGHLYAFSTLTAGQIKLLKKDFLPLVDPEFVSIVLNKQNEMVGFGLVLPSLSEALKKAKGSFYPFGCFHIWRALRHNDTIDMLLIGVVQEHQFKGAYALIFEKIFSTVRSRGIRYVETTRELEDNKKVLQLWSGYEKRLHKRARCYAKDLQS